jgi:hypothetical protein
MATSSHFQADFFDQIFNSLPDAIVFAHAQSLKVMGGNEAFKKLFTKGQEIADMPLRDLVNEDVFATGDIEALYSQPTTVLASVEDEEKEVFYSITSAV